MNVEILSIGRELLTGKIANTNAQWLAEQISITGHRVRRITVADDDVADIAEAVREAYNRGPGLIISTGGLGPTFDDKTLEGVAAAFNKPLIIHEDALKMLEEKYEAMVKTGLRQNITMTPERVKMATLPAGAAPIRNPVGSAPAVLLRQGNSLMFVLPGVPAEMKEIFKQSVLVTLKSELSGLHYAEDTVKVVGVMESELAPEIAQVMTHHPLVYIKSHPRGLEGSPKIELHFSCSASSETEALHEVASAVSMMKQRLQAMGGRFE